MTRPTAAPAHFPYDHRNMAEVMASERKARWVARYYDRLRYERERKAL